MLPYLLKALLVYAPSSYIAVCSRSCCMLREYGHLVELVIIRRELLYPPVFVPSHMYIYMCVLL